MVRKSKHRFGYYGEFLSFDQLEREKDRMTGKVIFWGTAGLMGTAVLAAWLFFELHDFWEKLP